jgi:hypothetical protein
MRQKHCSLSLAITLSALIGGPAHAQVRDLMSDTWTATDALGRTMPDFETAGPLRKDHKRVVGMFYITWHSDNLAKLKSPYRADVTKVLAANPEARLNGADPHWTEGSYHWGEPEMGYFLSKDEYVIRHDMSMLADAGVDVLVMDVTNAVRYWDEWSVLFPVMQKMKAEGNKVPQFCFWAFNGPVITVVQDLYDKIYKEKKYSDLWFYWDGKPLLLYNSNPNVDANGRGVDNTNPHYDPAAATDPANPHYKDPDYALKYYKDYTAEVKSFFTLRTMWWGYYEWAGKRFIGTEDNWSFGYDMGNRDVMRLKPEQQVSRHKGIAEEAAVTPGQHPSSLIGKSWTREDGEPPLDDHDLPVTAKLPWNGKTVTNPEGYGIYFQQRWEEALKADPQFLYINDWNEWTAGKYPPEGAKTTKFMRRDSTYFFVDQYNAEFNRSIQPMKGGYTDNYYMQMAENIRRYKGVRPPQTANGFHTAPLNGTFDHWKTVEPEYLDTIGDTIHRDYDGYGGNHYVDNSGRNDIVASRVAVDANEITFYVETRDPLTPHTDKNWMLLLLKTEKKAANSWYGYSHIVNLKVLDDKTTTLMAWKGDQNSGSWAEAAKLRYRREGNKLEIHIPRKLLGLRGNSIDLEFKWADNPADLKDPISLCTSGDTAPNRRFNYHFVWSK